MDRKLSKIIFFLPPIVFLSALFVLTHFFIIVAVLTDSMEPSIPRGSLVLAAKASDYQVGDIVLYRAFGALILHRIIEEKNGVFKTKGDAAVSPDPWLVPKEAILGRAVYVVPFLGEIVFRLKNPIVFAATVTLVYATSILAYMRREIVSSLNMIYGRINAYLTSKNKKGKILLSDSSGV